MELRFLLTRRHEAVDFMPRLQLCDLAECRQLRPGTVVIAAWFLGSRAQPVALRVLRISLGAYVGLDDRGREVQFHEAHVLRVLRRPS